MAAGDVFIYALFCPITDQVRYIGKAKDVVKRFRQHNYSMSYRNTPLYRWMRELHLAGQSPLPATIAKTTENGWEKKEKELIASYRKHAALLNVADGGNEPGLNLESNARNGRINAKAIHSAPYKKRIWHLKREIGSLLKQGCVKEETKQKLRYAAAKCPELFGKWASL